MVNLISNTHVFMVAEIGINHNGNMDTAFRLIDLAYEAGFDAVKFQMRDLNICYTPEEMQKPRETPFGRTNGDLKRQLELSREQYIAIDDYCKNLGILWTASPWDVPSLEKLMEFDPPYIKIASASVTDKGLLHAACKTKKPIMISTGMCDMPMIEKVINYITSQRGNLACVYHCTSTYPSDVRELNLKGIETLRRTFCVPVGYSGHERGVTTSVLAVALGAVSIERHITMDRAMFGSDQAASLEYKGMAQLVRDVRDAKVALGDGVIKVYDSEKPIIEKLRRVNDFE